MAKIEANKVKIEINSAPASIYNTSALSFQQTRSVPIHYTPIKSANNNVAVNQQIYDTLQKEEVRIAIMDAVARALSPDYKLPDKLIVGRIEYEIIKTYRATAGYIAISAWHRPSQKCIVRVKLQPSSFVIQRNEKVQASIISIIDTCLESKAAFPHTIDIDGTIYFTTCNYAPGSSSPLREGWLSITVNHGFIHIANVHLVESKSNI